MNLADLEESQPAQASLRQFAIGIAMARLSAAEGFNLGREIGVEGRKLNSSLGVRDGKRAAFTYAQACDGFFRKQNAEAVADFAELGLHRGIITEVITAIRLCRPYGTRIPQIRLPRPKGRGYHLSRLRRSTDGQTGELATELRLTSEERA